MESPQYQSRMLQTEYDNQKRLKLLSTRVAQQYNLKSIEVSYLMDQLHRIFPDVDLGDLFFRIELLLEREERWTFFQILSQVKESHLQFPHHGYVDVVSISTYYLELQETSANLNPINLEDLL